MNIHTRINAELIHWIGDGTSQSAPCPSPPLRRGRSDKEREREEELRGGGLGLMMHVFVFFSITFANNLDKITGSTGLISLQILFIL